MMTNQQERMNVMNDNDEYPTLESIRAAMLKAEDDAKLAKFGRYVAALLGSNSQWDSAADYLGEIADAADTIGILPTVNGTGDEPLDYWRGVADGLGIVHDVKRWGDS